MTMTRFRTWSLCFFVAAATGCSAPSTPQSVLRDAQRQMGAPATLEFVASGNSGWFGQSQLAGQEWPVRPMTRYTRSLNYLQRSAREELVFAEPVFGGQQQNTVVNGDKAWTVGANGPSPQPASAEERQLQIWLTPHGFVSAALAASDATLADAGGAREVSFTALGKFPVTGAFDETNRLVRVSTMIPNSILGDIPLVYEYGDYADFSGVQFPRTIAATQGEAMLWTLAVSDVRPGAAVDLPVPEAVAAATVPVVRTDSQRIADGVWFVGGGSHHSVVVEFADHLAVVEAPVSEERSLAVIAEAKRLVPGKPIKYLLTTHHHFDHTGGIRTYVAEGAAIVTHQTNAAYFEKAAAAPATVAPDVLARNPKAASVIGVSDRHILSDGRQTIEVYATSGDSHTKEYTLVYIKGPKILVEADAFSPGPADAPPPATPAANTVTLYESLQALNLDVATIAPIHGRGPVPIAELKRAAGRS